MTRIQEYLVERLSKTNIYEMAYDRSKYIDLINSLYIQIVENWCLIHYCTLYDPSNSNKNHWKQELQTHCRNIFFTKVKVNKKKTTSLALIDQNELDDHQHAYNIVRIKFEKEGLPLTSDISKDFSRTGLYMLINRISAQETNHNYQELYRYIDEDI